MHLSSKKKLTDCDKPKVSQGIPSGPGDFSVCALHVPLIKCVLSRYSVFTFIFAFTVF